MTEKVWVYLGLLLPTVWYAPVLRDLTILAPDIAAYHTLGESAQGSLARDVTLLCSSIYDIHLILLFCIGISLRRPRPLLIRLEYLHLGVTSAICLMYITMWSMMQHLIPGAYSRYDLAGFILIGGCVYTIRMDVKRVQKLTAGS